MPSNQKMVFFFCNAHILYLHIFLKSLWNYKGLLKKGCVWLFLSIIDLFKRNYLEILYSWHPFTVFWILTFLLCMCDEHSSVCWFYFHEIFKDLFTCSPNVNASLSSKEIWLPNSGPQIPPTKQHKILISLKFCPWGSGRIAVWTAWKREWKE